MSLQDFPGGSDGKASVYNVGDLGSIPGSGRFPEKEMATHSSTLAQKIPWTEEPGAGYCPWGCKESDTTEQLHFHFHFMSLQSCPTLCDPMNYSLPGSSVHGVLKNTGVDCHAILQGIFPPRDFLLYWQVNSLPLAPPGNPNLLSMKCYFLVNNVY